jgi:hypothetical protein
MTTESISTGARRSALRTAAMTAGIIFLAIGILGFIPGITTNYDELTWAGHESDALLLGIFQVSILHNIVHLLFGIAGLVMARNAVSARNYLIGGGVIYAILWIYGLIVDNESQANFVPMNTADDWLHLILAIAMIGAGVALSRTSEETAARSRARM